MTTQIKDTPEMWRAALKEVAETTSRTRSHYFKTVEEAQSFSNKIDWSDRDQVLSFNRTVSHKGNYIVTVLHGATEEGK